MGKLVRGREGALALLMVGLYLVASVAWGAPTDAPRINEIKQGTNESLWAFLQRFGGSFEAQIFYALFISGVIGAVASYTWKWSQGQANGNHWTARYVVGQLMWLAGISVAAIMTVGFTTEDGQFYGWLSVIWSGGFAGFSGDVKVKAPERKVWTDAERATASTQGGQKG